jgi:hypothetical protein
VKKPIFKFFKAYRLLQGDYYKCHIIRDDEVESFNVCAKTLKTFGDVTKRNLCQMGWNSSDEFVKNRLAKFEVVDLNHD